MFDSWLDYNSCLTLALNLAIKSKSLFVSKCCQKNQINEKFLQTDKIITIQIKMLLMSETKMT